MQQLFPLKVYPFSLKTKTKYNIFGHLLTDAIFSIFPKDTVWYLVTLLMSPKSRLSNTLHLNI